MLAYASIIGFASAVLIGVLAIAAFCVADRQDQIEVNAAKKRANLVSAKLKAARIH